MKNKNAHNLMRAAIAVCCSFVVPATYVQAQTSWLRANDFGGSGDTIAYSVRVGPDDQVAVSGQFTGTAMFGKVSLTSSGGNDIFLAKCNSAGKVLWAIDAGGSSDDYGEDVAFDQRGNIYLTGFFNNSAIFGSTNGVRQTATGQGQTMYLAKYSPSGVVDWVVTGVSGNPETVQAYGLAVQPETGTIYITGVGQGGVTFSSVNGSSNVVSGDFDWHTVVVKYDKDGNFQWGQTNSANPNSVPTRVAVDAEDNVYVTGWLENSTIFYSQDGENIEINGFSPGQSDSNYPGDLFVTRYDRDGNVKWVNHIGGYKGIGNGIAVSKSGEITVVGEVGNINYGSAGEADTIATSLPPGENIDLGGGSFTDPYNSDVVIATYDRQGSLKRALRVGGSENELATGVAYDSKGHLDVVGVYQGTMSALGQQLPGNSQQNLFVLQFDKDKLIRSTGVCNAGVWMGISNILTPSVSVDSRDQILISGGFQGSATFGTIDLTSIGGTDAFLSRLKF